MALAGKKERKKERKKKQSAVVNNIVKIVYGNMTNIKFSAGSNMD